MTVSVEGNNGESIQQKMIVYCQYEKAQETIEEQKQVIAILKQKVRKSIFLFIENIKIHYSINLHILQFLLLYN